MAFQHVGRCSPRHSILILFSMIMVSSLVTDTLAALDQAIVQFVCYPASPLVRPVITTSNSALSKAKSLTTEFLKKELNKEYADAMVRIHTFKTEWGVIKDIPKTPNTPTPKKTLEEMNEKNTLQKLFTDLHQVRLAIMERGHEAGEMGLLGDKTMFLALLSELDEVIEAVEKLLPGFKVKVPEKPTFDPPELAQDKSEHNLRNWIILHDYIILMEFTNDVSRYLMRKYCSLTID